jgi:hypothetical protein
VSGLADKDLIVLAVLGAVFSLNTVLCFSYVLLFRTQANWVMRDFPICGDGLASLLEFIAMVSKI